MTYGLPTMISDPPVPQTEEQVIAHFEANYTEETATELIAMFQALLAQGRAVKIAYLSTLLQYLEIAAAKDPELFSLPINMSDMGNSHV